ncbi:WAT1-related protein At4g30420-like isoform X2 [Mercurialis annua]|uniref:WAT1-related protein At4g30420-like isoform X2 n=1 Tax=Mercurialis annua TaxID=3986 RepID=UPI00216020F7|nr:WAT1-related protein At4g30420-like isoform X2 [Mercurialis annua]
MGGFDGNNYKPVTGLIGLQLMNAGIAIFIRAALLQGLSSMVFVVYRHAIAAFILAPLSYLSTRRNSCRFPLKLKSFSWIFLASLGLTANQTLYFEGLYLSSSTVGSAMNNLIPAITFVMATILGMEKLKVGSLRSLAKIIGTIFCVSGAITMAFLKGNQTLNTELQQPKLFISLQVDDYWLLGCIFLFASSCFYSLWIILQVPISASCPDYLYSSAWMSILATIESAAITLLVTKDYAAWNLTSYLQIGSCLYGGIVQALAFYIQAWCISQRGPLFTAMFNPLSTVIVTVIAAIFLHEETYLGSLIGAFAVIIGLYMVLWGKADDLQESKNNMHLELQNDDLSIVKLL